MAKRKTKWRWFTSHYNNLVRANTKRAFGFVLNAGWEPVGLHPASEYQMHGWTEITRAQAEKLFPGSTKGK